LTTIVVSVLRTSFSYLQELSCLELPSTVPYRTVFVFSESALTVPFGYVAVLTESVTKFLSLEEKGFIEDIFIKDSSLFKVSRDC